MQRFIHGLACSYRRTHETFNTEGTMIRRKGKISYRTVERLLAKDEAPDKHNEEAAQLYEFIHIGIIALINVAISVSLFSTPIRSFVFALFLGLITLPVYFAIKNRIEK